MSPSSSIGRIGGLAAALGIGAAIFTAPGIAWADPDASGNGTATDSGPRSAAVAPDAATSTAPTGASRTHVRRGGVAPGAQQSAPTPPALAARTADSAAGTPAADVLPQVKSRSSVRPGGAVPRLAPSAPSAAVADPAASLVLQPAAPTVSVVAPQAVAPAASLVSAPTAAAVPSGSLVTSNPLTPPHGLASVIANAVNHVSAAVGNVVNQLTNLFSGKSPLAPQADTPALWALFAAARRQLPGAAATGDQVGASQTTAATVEPTVVLNGYNVVPASALNVVSLYGQYTSWPSYPGQIQGNQTFNLVDPTSGQTVGSFKAMVGYHNSFGLTTYREIVVTDVLSGTSGTAAGQIPPVGSVISAVGDANLGTVYTAMPTASGKNAISYKVMTPFFTIPLFTTYDAAKNNTDNLLTYKPMELGKGYYMAPKAGATETQISATGFPPLFTAIQGAQTFSVYDKSNNVVGNFEGLVTATSDVAGIYTKAILVTANDGGADVGTDVSQVPPVGSVYNVIYFWSDNTYILYSSKPSSPKDVIKTKFVSPLGTSPMFSSLNASKAPDVKSYQVPGGYKFVPVSNLAPIGVNGLPPREVIIQGYQQFDVYDQAGKKIGSFDADVTRQWDNTGGHHEAILVTNVTSGTGGVTAGDIPPVGSVFDFRSIFPGTSDFYSSMPGPQGDLIASSFVTPFGFIPFWNSYDASAGVRDYTYVDPYDV